MIKEDHRSIDRHRLILSAADDPGQTTGLVALLISIPSPAYSYHRPMATVSRPRHLALPINARLMLFSAALFQYYSFWKALIPLKRGGSRELRTISCLSRTGVYARTKSRHTVRHGECEKTFCFRIWTFSVQESSRIVHKTRKRQAKIRDWVFGKRHPAPTPQELTTCGIA